MGDRMHLELVVGPVTTDQKANKLSVAMEEFLHDLGLDGLEPEPLEGDPRRFKFTLEEINYGISGVALNGRLEDLIQAGIPYRIADDGGAYHDGSDAIWHPDFGEEWVLRRAANTACQPILTRGFLDQLEGLTDQGVGRIVRGYLLTDPSEPALADTFQFLRFYLRRADRVPEDYTTTTGGSLNPGWWRVALPNCEPLQFNLTESDDPNSNVIRCVFRDGTDWVSFDSDQVNNGTLGKTERLNDQEVIELVGAID